MCSGGKPPSQPSSPACLLQIVPAVTGQKLPRGALQEHCPRANRAGGDVSARNSRALLVRRGIVVHRGDNQAADDFVREDIECLSRIQFGPRHCNGVLTTSEVDRTSFTAERLCENQVPRLLLCVTQEALELQPVTVLPDRVGGTHQ